MATQDLRQAAAGSTAGPTAEQQLNAAALAAQANPTNNPAVDATAHGVTERNRIPMSGARRKLEVPEIPGYHTHWFLRANVYEALGAGYEDVDPKEIADQVNNHRLGDSVIKSGNSSLGNTVEVPTRGPDGPTQLRLMKIRDEWFQKDQRDIAERNLLTIKAVFRQHAPEILGSGEVKGADKTTRYVRQDMTHMEMDKPARQKTLLNRGLPKQR